MLLFRELARNMALMTNIECLSTPEILKMGTNIGENASVWGTGQEHGAHDDHHDNTLRFLTEVVPLCSLYSLIIGL